MQERDGEATTEWWGGWASDPGAWACALRALDPGTRHDFLPVQGLQDLHPAALGEGVRRRGPATVVAWSLGSLLALRCWNEGHWPSGVRLVAVCPVLDFCLPGGPWRARVLERMIRGLSEDRTTVLSQFRDLLWPGMPEGLAAPWEERAASIPLPELVRGLEVLRDLRLEGVRDGDGLCLVEGAADRVSPSLSRHPGIPASVPRWRLATGHVPFLEDPEGFRDALVRGR